MKLIMFLTAHPFLPEENSFDHSSLIDDFAEYKECMRCKTRNL